MKKDTPDPTKVSLKQIVADKVQAQTDEKIKEEFQKIMGDIPRYVTRAKYQEPAKLTDASELSYHQEKTDGKYAFDMPPAKMAILSIPICKAGYTMCDPIWPDYHAYLYFQKPDAPKPDPEVDLVDVIKALASHSAAQSDTNITVLKVLDKMQDAWQHQINVNALHDKKIARLEKHLHVHKLASRKAIGAEAIPKWVMADSRRGATKAAPAKGPMPPIPQPVKWLHDNRKNPKMPKKMKRIGRPRKRGRVSKALAKRRENYHRYR